MKNQEIDILIKATLDPYLVIKLKFNHTEEEFKLFDDKFKQFENQLDNNCIGIEIKFGNCFIIMKKRFIGELLNFLNINNINYIVTDGLDEIWNMKDLTLFENIWDENNSVNLMEVGNPMPILKLLVLQKYSIDDVLYKISNKGIDSLNELNKYILDKESH